MKKHKAEVVVNRESHGGWFHGGKFYANGRTEAELTEQEATSLAARPGVVVLIGGKAVAPQDRAGRATGIQVQLQEDELAALEQYRRERAQQASQPRNAQQERGLEFQTAKESRGAVQQLADNPTDGRTTGNADAPLLAADELQGKPPPENATANVKPLESSPSGKKK